MKKLHWLFFSLLLTAGQGCLPPTSHRIFWAYPDNLKDGRSYEYEVDYEAGSNFISECGSGAVARHCPEEKNLPKHLLQRYEARRLSGHGSSLRNDDPAGSLIIEGGRYYFFDSIDDAVMAGEEGTGRRLWRAEAGAAYVCFAPIAVAGGSVYLGCRHKLGTKHIIFAFSADTGEVQGGLPLEERVAALVPGKDRVLILQSDGVLLSWRASDESAAVAAELEDVFQSIDELLPGQLRAPAPALATEQLIYLGGKRNQWALDTTTLKPVWKYAVSNQVTALLLPEKATALYVLTAGVQILTLDPDTGKELAVWEKSQEDINWLRAVLGPSPHWEAISWNRGDETPGQVVFCDGFGLCYGFDTLKNSLRWAMSVGPRYRTAHPYILDGNLLVDLVPDRLLLFLSLPIPAEAAPVP